jgi:cbb3-type cytochrome oxidase maturation protein
LDVDILYLLLPLSVLLVFGILGLFAWALRSGQFEDLEREGQRLLEDDAGEQAPN